jgi:hypothetical protein
MIDNIDSEIHQPGESFQASLAEPLQVDGREIAPRGADALVRLTQAEESGRISGKAVLAVELASVTVDGHQVSFNTESVVTESGSRGSNSAKVIGGTAALGAIIGAIAGGGRGAAIGAASGAGAGTAVQVIRGGDKVKIPSETLLSFRTTSEATVD